jgi:hypothetical protein
MGKHIHKLREIDVLSKKAICLNCGLVDICKTSHGWRCSVVKRKEKRREGYKKRYGLILVESSIPDICKICKRKTKLSLDHNHKTGKIRGWICSQCNSIMGFANDDIQRLKNVIQYIRENS